MKDQLIGINEVAKFTGTPFATVKEEWCGAGKFSLPTIQKPTERKIVTKVHLRGLWKSLDREKRTWETYSEFREDFFEWRRSRAASPHPPE